MSLKQAISAIKAGDKTTARKLLTKVLKADPRNEYAWLWMTEVVERKEDILKCLQNVLKINPNSEIAKKRLAILQQQAGEVEPNAPQESSEPPANSATSEESSEPPSESALSLEIAKGELVIDFEKERVTIDDEEILLSPVELELLYVLAQYKGQVVSYDLLLTEVWEVDDQTSAHVSVKDIEKYIYFLRRRFEDDPDDPTLIQHEEGTGYRFG